MAIGIGFAVAGLVFIWKAWRADFSTYIGNPEAKPWVMLLGRVGFASRGVAFLLVGGFLLLAGLHSNPEEAEGLGGALRRLQEFPYGWLLLSMTAVGLIAYGLFAFAEAFYRPVRPPNLKAELKELQA
jgi:hypothetical protein